MELIEERRRILLNTPHIETISTSAFKTDMVAPFKKLEARFEAEQSGSGDPSPDNVRPIEGRKELIVRHSGVNIWDEEWELGSLNNSTGEKVSSSSSIRSKNFIPVRPNTQYYFPNLDGYVLQYDQNKGYIGILANRNTKPTDATCYYLMFRLSTNYGTVYKNDYSINYPATVTEYEPYIEAGYPIGKNLLNAEAVTSHKYINAGGVPSDSRINIGYLSYTDFIPVSEGEAYTISVSGKDSGSNTGAFNWFTDKDLTTIMSTRPTFSISSAESYSATNIAPVGAKFLIVNFVAGTENQIEQGSSPTAFEEYKGVGYKVDLRKNLFDKDKELVKNKYISADGSITTSSAYQYSDYYTTVKPNTNYVFSGVIAITNAYNTISFYDNSKTFIGRHVPPKGKTGANFITPSNCSYIRFNLGMDADLDTIQLEESNIATEYQPYYDSLYGGTVDLVSGVMTVDRAGIMLTESLPWGSYNLIPAGDRYRTYVNVTGKISETAGNYKPLCDKLTPVANAYPPAYGVSVNNLGNILVGMPTTITTKQDFLEWIAEQRPFVVYPIAEPYTIQLTPQQILTLKNNNTLMPEGSINELKYWTHI